MTGTMEVLAKYDQIEEVLGEPFDPFWLPKMEQDWKAFYRNPEKYRGTAVVDMVNQWLDDQPLRWN